MLKLQKKYNVDKKIIILKLSENQKGSELTSTFYLRNLTYNMIMFYM